MQDGYVVLKANAGGKPVTIKTTEKYNDDKWHMITIAQLAGE